MKSTVDASTEAQILRLILDEHKMLGDVAMRLAMSRSRVEHIAQDYGWPDETKMRAALDAFDSEDTALDPTAAVMPATLGSGRSLAEVPVADLVPDPDNPRDNLPDIEALAESIASQGLIQPIVARRRGGRLVVVAGHRRLAAVKLLGLDVVDVVITRDMPSDDILAQQLVENGQRAGLDPIEEARALSRLKSSTGLNGVGLGQKIGRAQSYVDGRLALLSLTPHEQELVRSGQMGITEAIDKARVDSGRRVGARSQYAFHLGAAHPLADRARAMCRTHGPARMVGSVACGECWEHVIRADERDRLDVAEELPA